MDEMKEISIVITSGTREKGERERRRRNRKRKKG
jgi:hypothetical protein